MPTELSKYLFYTADGSPTLAPGGGEKMHSAAGAFTETIYIYGGAVEEVLKRQWAPRFLSVGLGLGYVELVTVALCLKHNVAMNDILIDSRETDPELIDIFKRWIQGESVPGFEEGHQRIESMLGQHFDLDPKWILLKARQLLVNQQLLLRGAVEIGASYSPPYSAILFDPFSNNTTPELWDEAFLLQFFSDVAAHQCVVTTYSSKGNLKRALRKNWFELLPKEGFWKKRESTLAIRGHT